MIPASFIILAEAVSPVAAESSNKYEDLFQRFGIYPSLFLSQLVAFFVVCLLLKKFAYGPVLEMLEQRQARIASGEEKLKEIEQKLADSEETTAALIAKANEDAKRLIDEAKESSAKIAEQKSKEAVATAQNIIAKAEEAAKAERAEMAASLKKEFGRLVVATTSQVTGKTLNDDDQKRLNKEALTSFESN